MGKCLISICHSMDIFLLLYRCPCVIRCIKQLTGKPFPHCLFRPYAGIAYQPSKCQRHAPLRPYFHRHLICCAANPPRFNLQHRFNIFQRSLKKLKRIIVGFLLDNFKCPIAYSFSCCFLPSSISTLINLLTTLLPYFGSGKISRFSATLLLGIYPLRYLGLLAPYLDLPCLLSATPIESSVPLIMWYPTPGRSLTFPPLIITIECS